MIPNLVDDLIKKGSQVPKDEKILQEFNNKDKVEHIKSYGNKIAENTTLQQFYNGQTLFVTGGTGFLGKILIEKLLRCCPNISRMYVLIREKKGKNIDERIQDLLTDSVFTKMRISTPMLSKKIFGIRGDISLLRLGLSDADIALLMEEVSIVYHMAATVRFDEKLQQASAFNIQSAASMLELCKDMKHLKSLVHVSTAYANCFVKNIEERFYDYPLKYHELLNLVNTLPEDTINAITPQLIDSWPNTYTFTKALAEDLVRTENKSLPMGIFRPGIVTSTANEPTPGWTDNYNGPMGVMAGVASGIIRTFHCDTQVIPNLVPVDLTVNAMIACAWDISSQTEKRNEDMLIYNFTSTKEAPISWGSFAYGAASYIDQYPSEVASWYKVFRLSKFKFIYTLNALFLHWIPAYLVDFVFRSVGQKPKLKKVYEKLEKVSDALRPFCLKEWEFENTNVQSLWSRLDSRDQEIFPFTMQNFDWHSYLDNYMKGIRIYLLKDDMKTLEKSKAKYNRFYYIHHLILICISFLACWSLYSLYSAIF